MDDLKNLLDIIGMTKQVREIIGIIIFFSGYVILAVVFKVNIELRQKVDDTQEEKILMIQQHQREILELKNDKIKEQINTIQELKAIKKRTKRLIEE